MYQRGLITENERYNKSVEIWTKATNDVTDVMMDNMDPFNSIFMMADSGARGSATRFVSCRHAWLDG